MEVGSNTNMKKDTKQGGKMSIAANGSKASYVASASDAHFTLMCYTANGEPVQQDGANYNGRQRCDLAG